MGEEKWFGAKVTEVNSDGTFTVDWDDLDYWDCGKSDEGKDIWRMFRSAFTGTDVPEDLVERTCPAPIIEDSDPRVAYQQEMQKIVGSVFATATS